MWAAFRTISATVVVAVALSLGAAPADAQENPYGSTSTTVTLPRATPSCDLSVAAAAPGTSVRATVATLQDGDVVRLLFDGEEVGRGTATASAGDDAASVVIDFFVPSRPPGDYSVSAVSGTSTIACGRDGGVGFAVLSAAQGPARGPLPRTGVYVGLLLALATGLLVFGRGFVSASRRAKVRRAEPRHRAGV